MADYDTFTGVSHVGHPTYIENLYENFAGYLDWAFLNIGAFQNVRRNQTVYGQDPAQLRRVTDSPYTNGRIWESYRKGWVWESGLYYETAPITISGVYINSTFYPISTTGTYAHQINYREGQVIFTNPLPTGTNVQIEYSYKLYNIYQLDRNPWFNDILYGDWVTTYGDFNQAGSGAFTVLAKNRVGLPFIGVEVVPRRNFRGLQLGGGQIVEQDILFWICGQNAWQVNNAVDYISFQNNKTFKLYNIKFVQDASRQPYKYDGTLNPSGQTYKQLIDNYFWKKAYSVRTYTEGVSQGPLYINLVRMTLSTDFEEI